jgi:hypothetical protein
VYVTEADEFVAMYLQEVKGERREVSCVRPQGVALTGAWVSDPEVARAITAPAAEYEARVVGGVTQEEKARATVECAVALGEELGASRPVYCNSESLRPPLGRPVEGVAEDLFRVGGGQVRRVSIPDAGQVAKLSPSVSLARCELSPASPRAGELVRVQLDWRCGDRISESLLVQLRLVPPGLPLGEQTERDYLLRHRAWFLSGLLPVAATGSNAAYRQELTLLIPTNGPAGEWVLLAALTHEGGKAEFHEIGRLRVAAQGERR